MAKHLRLNFSDRVKAEIYARDKALCAFCGCDLWMFRHGASPLTGHDWADHIRPSARGGSNSPDNGITACHACNSKKSDNTRDQEYFFRDGRPTSLYFKRFDHLNPLVAATAHANVMLEWTDWYFNRAIGKLLIAADELRDLALGYDPRKRTPDYWVNAGLRFASEWRRFDPTGIDGLRSRGFIPVDLQPDQEKILQFFECDSVEEGLGVARALVPWMVGHRFFYILKCHVFAEPVLGGLVATHFGSGSSDESAETFLRHPLVASHALVINLEERDIVRRDGDHLVPRELPGWPPLPAAKMASLIDLLRAEGAKNDSSILQSVSV